MQERKQENISMDFSKAKDLMIQALNCYLHYGAGHSHGVYHGKAGKNRANSALKSIKLIADDNKPALLALLLAIFGKPSAGFFETIGRSSALAAKIANYFINGEYENSHYRTMFGSIYRNNNTLSSQVFSLEQIKNCFYLNYIQAKSGSIVEIDKTKSLRYIIQEILNSPEFLPHKKLIEELAKKLSSELTSDNFEIKENAFLDIKNFTTYKDSVSVAFFNTTRPLPEDITSHISTLLTPQDVARLAATKKIAGKAAHDTNPVNLAIKNRK